MRTICAAAIMLGTSFVEPAWSEIRRMDHQVDGKGKIRLFVREVVERTKGSAGTPVILLHGARVPGVASFDLDVERGSLAADLAHAGHRAFIMDARGYGKSTRPDAMSGSQDGEPLVASHEVVRDIDSVVEWVKRRTGRSQVALLGWATGGHWAGMYASLEPQNVSHLIIYNALYGAHAGHNTLGPGSETADPGNPNCFNAAKYGAYRLNTAASLMPSWDRSIPTENKQDWRDPAIAEAYQRQALASDAMSSRQKPPAFRAPSGAMQDSFYLASGRQLWDASSITGAVLIIRSGNDFWSRPEDMIKLQEHLVRAAYVKVVTIPDATHYVHLDRPEKGRDRFLAEVFGLLARRSE